MIKSATRLEILTLGCFSITLDSTAVATYWPDEAVKACFCSLLSPLDLYFSWDRICRSLLAVPDSQQSRQQLEETALRPLRSFLITELGFNPLITGDENIRIDHRCIHVDAFDFHNSAVEGLKLLSNGNHVAAMQKLTRAKSLYAGKYLPGMQGKIITNTRNELEALYQKVVLETARQSAADSARALKQVSGQKHL